MRVGEIVVSKYTGNRVLVSEINPDGTFAGKLQGRFGYWWHRWEQSSFRPDAPPPIERREDVDQNEPGDLSPDDEKLAAGIRG